MQFWRKLEGLDPWAFAEEVGRSRSYVGQIESGHTACSLRRVAEIAKILEVSPYTLLCGIPTDNEIEALSELYADSELEVTKGEMELLFRQRVAEGFDPKEYYKHILCLIRDYHIPRVNALEKPVT
jgi:transcriptional regulator with XRE-family HTH domain